MTVYRRPDPIPRHRARPTADAVLHTVRNEQEDLHRLVSRQIFAAIISGGYPEGSILPTEESLSHELGVSRTALRESVKGLVAKGILETKRRRGTLVLPRSSWNLFDADVIAWLCRDDGRSVTGELLQTLGAALAAAGEMAAVLRASGNLSRSPLFAGETGTEARANFILELGLASSNRFIASLLSTAVRALLGEGGREFDAWSHWLDRDMAQHLVSLLNAGDSRAAGALLRRVDSDALSAVR